MICYIQFFFENFEEENDDTTEDYEDEDADLLDEEEYKKEGTEHQQIHEFY